MSLRYRDLPRSILPIIFAFFVVRIGQAMVLPFFAIFLAQHFQVSAVMIGLVLAAGPVCFALSSFNCGHWIDRFGARTVVLWSLILGGVAYLLMYFMHAILAYLLINAALGVTRSAYNASARSYIYLKVDPKLRAVAFSAQYVAINAGFGIGLLIGAYFASLHSKLLFPLIAVLYVVLFFILRKILQPASVERREALHLITFKNTFHTIISDRKLLLIVLANLLLWTAYSQLDSTLPYYLGIAVTDGAWLYFKVVVVNSILCVVLQPIVSRLFYQTSHFKQIICGVSFFVVGFLFFTQVHNVWLLMIAMALATVGEVIILPLTDTIIGVLAKSDRSGAYYGANNLTYFGNALGPLMGSLIYEMFNIEVLFILAAVLCACLLPLYRKVTR